VFGLWAERPPTSSDNKHIITPTPDSGMPYSTLSAAKTLPGRTAPNLKMEILAAWQNAQKYPSMARLTAQPEVR
jgi:hypothetical protein